MLHLPASGVELVARAHSDADDGPLNAPEAGERKRAALARGVRATTQNLIFGKVLLLCLSIKQCIALDSTVDFLC